MAQAQAAGGGQILTVIKAVGYTGAQSLTIKQLHRQPQGGISVLDIFPKGGV